MQQVLTGVPLHLYQDMAAHNLRAFSFMPPPPGDLGEATSPSSFLQLPLDRLLAPESKVVIWNGEAAPVMRAGAVNFLRNTGGPLPRGRLGARHQSSYRAHGQSEAA